MTSHLQVALVYGSACSIGQEVMDGLGKRGIQTLAVDDCFSPGKDAVAQATNTYQRLDFVFNCLTPSTVTTTAQMFAYPQQVLERGQAACEAMVACQSAGAVVNQCFLGSLYAGTPLEPAILMSKGAITGLTRQLCVRFGKAGIRINTVQAGLTQMPENEGLVTPETLARKTPVGRWAQPSEVAKLMLFLALRNGYMTGQSICFDGGLTAGLTGT